jgi:hypothetical protein
VYSGSKAIHSAGAAGSVYMVLINDNKNDCWALSFTANDGPDLINPASTKDDDDRALSHRAFLSPRATNCSPDGVV